MRGRIRHAIEAKLASHPEEHEKPLAYTTQGLWSLRVGDWRVTFALRDDEVWILAIGHSRDVYDDLKRRGGPPEQSQPDHARLHDPTYGRILDRHEAGTRQRRL